MNGQPFDLKRSLLFMRTIFLNAIFYSGVGFLPFLKPTEVSSIGLDAFISFTPYAVYPYFSFFFMIWLSIALVETESRSRRLAMLISMSAALASIIYLFLPMKVTTLYFDMQGCDPATTSIFNLMKADTSLTFMPSLHGAITAICIAYLWRARKPKWNAMLLAWGLLIYWSAISLRQHLSMDIIVGMFFGIAILAVRGPLLFVLRFGRGVQVKSSELV